MTSSRVSGFLGSNFTILYPLKSAIHKLPSTSTVIPSGLPFMPCLFGVKMVFRFAGENSLINYYINIKFKQYIIDEHTYKSFHF